MSLKGHMGLKGRWEAGGRDGMMPTQRRELIGMGGHEHAIQVNKALRLQRYPVRFWG